MRQKSYRPVAAQRAPVYHFPKASHTFITYTLNTEKATARDILGLKTVKKFATLCIKNYLYAEQDIFVSKKTPYQKRALSH